ncbi:MAG: hypothetical protein M1838_001804 [Thelocarpon superellum]|nr:MAG: hypothetical protein M1838_001804 [Thelocarpon superellum]
MTQLSSSVALTTHTAPSLHPAESVPATPPVTNGTLSSNDVPADDEPYTIKCICGFQDDDGNTVFCEKCETWQHIECYYHGKKVPDVHKCVDCGPRSLDAKRANERQRRRREQQDLGERERKPKRPLVPKSHKKKPRDATAPTSTGLVNGRSPSDKHEPSGSAESGGSPRDQPPPAKRPKTSHRPSSSISSQVDTKASSLTSSDSHRRSRSQPQTAKSPKFSSVAPEGVPIADQDTLYSEEFMRLHPEDPGDSPLQANLLSNINFTSTFSSWIQDPDALRQATNGKVPGEVFQRIDRPFDELQVPQIIKRTKDDKTIQCHGRTPVWQYLTVESLVPSGGLVGELKGEIGHLQDYWHDSANRSSLRHPEPFVFFHPQLPIYIDTRREGTRCRYVRRSCRPNVMMRTLISDGADYHFCLCAREDLSPGTELTVEWDPEPEILALLNRGLHDGHSAEIKGEPLSRGEHDYLSSWVQRILANFGGCACESPRDCVLAPFDRRRTGGSEATSKSVNGIRSKKTKRGKQQVSPLSTGQATNSRAGSEGGPRDVEHEHDDSRSTSGSIRSRPRSRDMTPLTHFSSDMPASTGPEMSDREKRKIAALERTFEQLEQDNSLLTQKKKRRPGSGSNVNVVSTPNGPVANTSQPSTPDLAGRTDFSDDQGHRGPSHSPPSNHPIASAPSGHTSLSRPPPSTHGAKMTKPPSNYTDASMQTDGNGGSSSLPGPSPKSGRHAFIPLTKRLLMRCHDDKVRLAEERQRKADAVDDGIPENQSNTGTAMTPPGSTEKGTAASRRQSIAVDPTPSGASQPPEEKSVPAIQPIDPNVQKPGRADGASSAGELALHDTSADAIKPPPAPSRGPSTSDAHGHANGHRPTDLHVQLPATPVFSHHPNGTSTPSAALTPTSMTGSMAQSPMGLHQLSTSFGPSVVQAVQPSPIKKKLSLSDYSRRKKAETPLTTPGENFTAGTSPNMSHAVLRQSSSIADPAGEKPGASATTTILEESTVLESPAVKNEGESVFMVSTKEIPKAI